MRQQLLLLLCGVVFVAASVLVSAAPAAAVACEDVNDNGACDGGEPLIPAAGGVFANPVLVTAGNTVTCPAPPFSTSIEAPKITVNGTVQCFFAGGAGVTLRSTGAGGIRIGPNAVVQAGGNGVVLQSATTIDVDHDAVIRGLANGSIVQLLAVGNITLTGTAASSVRIETPNQIVIQCTGNSCTFTAFFAELFTAPGSGIVFITTDGDQTYGNVTVVAGTRIAVTSTHGAVLASGGGPDPCDAVVPFTIPAAAINNAADRDAWQAALAAANPGKILQQLLDCLCFVQRGGQNVFRSSETGVIVFLAEDEVDLAGALILAGKLIQITSTLSFVGLVGADLENTQTQGGALAGGGNIVLNSGTDTFIQAATLRDGGADFPNFDGVDTCGPVFPAGVIGVPTLCE